MASADKGRHTQTDDARSTPNQDAVEPGSSTRTTRSSKQQARHRASVACSSCRDRRIRCVVPDGESECTQCQRAGSKCVIKNDDERRRPISKAYMSSLSRRIMLLESMLAERGVTPPPAVHPPKTRQEAQRAQPSEDEVQKLDGQTQQTLKQPCADVSDSADAALVDTSNNSGGGSQMLQSVDSQDTHMPATSYHIPHRREDLLQRVLSTKNSLSLDQISECLHAELDHSATSRPPPEAVKQIESLTAPTHDYLLDCFWEFYNASLYVVDREAFETSRATQDPRFYSSFLHTTMLAMGFRFADRSRADIKNIGLGSRESSLQRDAKRMLDSELARPASIPCAQALLLLGDLECGAGRGNAGWMYASMAGRLASDLGLHLNGRSRDMDDREARLRCMVMRAAAVADQHQALFHGRPAMANKHVSGSSPCQLPRPAKASSEEIYEYQFELLGLAGKIVEIRDGGRQPADIELAGGEEVAHLHAMRLDRQLRDWYRRLPDHLAWKPENIKAAPASFFLLHQQYHVSMILLHRPWAKYESILSSLDCSSSDSRTALSRGICTQQAVQVARIFWQHRQRFDGRRAMAASIQHAGAAATALIAALAGRPSSAADRRSHLSYLEILSRALADVSHVHQPAAHMDGLLKAVLEQLQSPAGSAAPESENSSSSSSSGGGGSSLDAYAILPVLRKSPDDADAVVQASKKKRPAPARRASSSISSVFSPPSSSRSGGDRSTPSLGFASGSGAAIDIEGAEEMRETAELLRCLMDDNILIRPESDSMADEDHKLLLQQQQQHHHHHHGVDPPDRIPAAADADRQAALACEPADGDGQLEKTAPIPRYYEHARTLPLGPAALVQGALSDDAQHVADWMDPVIRKDHRHARGDHGDGRPLDGLLPASMGGLVVPTAKKTKTIREGGTRGAKAREEEGSPDEHQHGFDFYSF